MWWNPRSEQEFSLATSIAQLQRWFRERRGPAPSLAWGIASCWSPIYEQLAPTVLLDSGLLEGRGHLRHADQKSGPFAIPVDLLSSEGNGLPRGWDAPLPRLEARIPLHVMFVSPPEPSASAEGIMHKYITFKEPVVCEKSGKLGTAGVAVWDDAVQKHSILTAGHIFPKGVGSPVSQRRKNFFGFSRRVPLGVISHHICPNGSSPTWDAAIIRLSRAASYATPRTGIFPGFNRPEPVVAYGAFSGPVDEGAILQGALVEGGSGQFNWKNCWMLAPATLLTSGDSGTAIFTRKGGEFLGLFVGTSYFVSSGRSIVHYVQDAKSLETEVLKQWHIRFQ